MQKLMNSRHKRFFRFSLSYKMALPIFVFVLLMFLMLSLTTYRFVRDLVIEKNKGRLQAIAEVFTESLKVPLILNNQEVMIASLDWMASRSDVVDVRVENEKGVVIGNTNPTPEPLPEAVKDKKFMGVHEMGGYGYVVAVPIRVGEENLGRALIIFSQMGFEVELKQIFVGRMLFAFSLGVFLVFLTSILTWFILRPLFQLKRTVQEILAGDVHARANIHSSDEIEDLAEAFNEMVSRLSRSLENLRSRTHALEESEEKYRLIVDNASDIIFALTPDGEIVFLNEGFSGCSREEIMQGGLNLICDLHSADTRERFEEALTVIQETKTSVTNVPTTHLHRWNQNEIYYLTNLTPLVDHEGHVKLIQGVMRDVTELRRIEIMKESLIRDVAHELKTPASKFEMVVHWFESEMEKDEGLKKYAELIEMMKSNTGRLMSTITSIMDLSKLESGALQITKTELDLNELIESVARDLEPLCGQKGIELSVKPAPEKLTLQGDRDMLYRLFVNLISNSIKFAPGGKITVKSYKQLGDIFVEVSDTGIGIAPEDLESIFERFVQKTASSMGIGVGLTICRDIASLHNAKIWAESEGLGKGSTFKVEFK